MTDWFVDSSRTKRSRRGEGGGVCEGNNVAASSQQIEGDKMESHRVQVILFRPWNEDQPSAL